MNRRVYFRCDANSIIGMGHVMRCLSIADAFVDHGFQPVFLLADVSAEQVVQKRGFHSVILNSDYRKMEEELPKTLSFLKNESMGEAPFLFVDSYFTTAAYLNYLREYAFVVYIDDVLDYPYPVDVLLNYNIFAEEKAYKELYNNTDVRLPKLLLGTKFVPLRKQFRNLPKRVTSIDARNVLISTGGADPNHIALQLAEHLEDQGFSEKIVFHFLLGALNNDLPALVEIARKNLNVILERNVMDMAGLMRSCNLAVAASGSTLYELCACGVPIINYSFADNQLGIAAKLEELGVSRYVGDYRYSGKESFCKSIFDSIRELCCNPVQRANMIKKGYSTSDGYGADRVVMQLVSRQF